MFKVAINSRIRQKMSLVLGENFEESKYSVYETIANDSLPISGTSGIYKNAVMSSDFLMQMASVAKNGYVPMINLHDEYTQLPVGRIFDAELFDGVEGRDLHVLFYILSDSNPESLDQKLQSGIVNAVSSGSYPNKLSCSACNAELTATEESIQDLIYEGKCASGHQLHKDFHIIMSDLKNWDELSFVVQGAVPRAKLLSHSKQKLAHKSDALGFAASTNIGKLRFNASVTPESENGSGKPQSDKGKGNNMNKIELEQSRYDTLVKLEGSNETLKSDLTAANTAKSELQTQLSTVTGEKTVLEAEKVALEKAKTDLEAEKAALEDEKVELTAKVTALQTQLSTLGIPEGGASKTSNANDGVDPLDVALFKRA